MSFIYIINNSLLIITNFVVWSWALEEHPHPKDLSKKKIVRK